MWLQSTLLIYLGRRDLTIPQSNLLNPLGSGGSFQQDVHEPIPSGYQYPFPVPNLLQSPRIPVVQFQYSLIMNSAIFFANGWMVSYKSDNTGHTEASKDSNLRRFHLEPRWNPVVEM